MEWNVLGNCEQFANFLFRIYNMYSYYKDRAVVIKTWKIKSGVGTKVYLGL